MRNAADDVSAVPTIPPGGVTPQRIIVTANSYQANLALIAPTEGDARFIAGSPAIVTEPQRGMRGALARLACQCGYALSGEMTSAVVVAGPPVRLHIVGERSRDDATALGIAERYGVAHVVAETAIPSRQRARNRSWCQPLTDLWRAGRIEALLVVIPPGALPLWAAQLLTALNETESSGDARCLVLTSDTALAAAVPPDTIVIPRGDQSARQLTNAMNRMRTTRCRQWIPDESPLLSRPEALAVAMRAVSVERGQPSVYLDVSEGTTAIIADESGATVYHDPDIDCARGVIRLLNRCAPEQIARWVPFTLDAQFLRTWALRRVSWPMALLTDDEDRAIAAAFARVAIRLVLGKAFERIPDGALWMLGPTLTQLGSSAAALRLVADLMPTIRVAVVACDSNDLIPAVGALAIPYPADASSLLAHDAILIVGSVVQASLAGERTRGALSATLVHDGRTRTTEVAADALTTIVCEGAATLRLTGHGTGGTRIALDGGAGGVLMDTRRRPLAAVTAHASRPNVSGRLRPAATGWDALNDA